MKPECSNCQLVGGPLEIGRPDISCMIKVLAEKAGVRNIALKEPRGFFCNCYWPYGKKGLEFTDTPYLETMLEGVEDNG